MSFYYIFEFLLKCSLGEHKRFFCVVFFKHQKNTLNGSVCVHILCIFQTFFLCYQILFLSGLVFIIGLRRTADFFFQRQKLRSSAFFLGGVALVLLRWPRIGMLVETYGFVLLFKSFFPMAFGFLATALNIPFLITILNKFSGSSSSMV